MSFRISLRLSDKMYEKIKKVSDDLSDSLSDVCRTAIKDYIVQYENEKTNKKINKNDKTLNDNYINQLKDEITYLKAENINLREKIDMNIANIKSQLETVLSDTKNKEKYKKLKIEHSNSEKDLFITRM